MSKHMKKLISTLLCGAMLLSSMSLNAFAEGTDAAADTTAAEVTAIAEEATAAPEATEAEEATTEATAAPEVTEAPAATVAPTAAPAAEDEYFDEAIGLLSALKIFEGYEDGSIKPESTITRAEMAAVILRTLGNKSLTKYTGMFTDVDASHWAADTIQTAADLGIINGMGDGTFAPDAPVKYEQAIKMTVCALNYGAYADYNGGYPMGYISLASRNDMKLTKSIGGALGTDATRGTIVKLIYNALNAPYPTLTGFDYQGPIYSTVDGKTLASEKHRVYISQGILTGTKNKSIDAGSMLMDTQISIDGDVFESTAANADDLVGQYVKAYYYDPTGNGGEETVLYMTPVINKNNVLAIDADKITKIEDIYSTTNSPIVRYEAASGAKKKAELVKSPVIVYNNEVLTRDKIPAMQNGETVEDFLTPDVGSIKLGDFDNDGIYDIIFIEKYVTIVVKSSSEKRVNFEYPVAGYTSMDLEIDNDKFEVSLVRDGETIKTRHLQKYNVISAMMNSTYLDPEYTGTRRINAVVTTATLTGIPRSYTTDDEGNYITTVDGKEYFVDDNAADDLRSAVGAEATMYLDQFDRIAYVEKSGAGKLAGNEKYGWIITSYVEDGGDVPSIKMFTQDNEVVTYEVDSEIDYWDKTTVDANKNSVPVVLNTTSGTGLAKILALKDASTYAGSVASVRLCKYKVNSENLITKLYLALSTATVIDEKLAEEAVIVNTGSLRGVRSSGTILSGYSMQGDLTQFVVPDKDSEMSDIDSYKSETVAASSYLNYKDGIDEAFIVAEFDGKKPTMVIKFVASSEEDASLTYGNADDNSVMMVSKIMPAVNDDDEIVYKITGYYGASETTITTTNRAVLSQLKTSYPSSDVKVGYEATAVWAASSGADLRDYLKPGDIVGISGGTMMRFVSVDQFAKDAIAGFPSDSSQLYGYYYKSESRDVIAIAGITGVEIDSSALISMEGTNEIVEVSIDTEMPYVEVQLNADGTYSANMSTETLSASAIEPVDGSREEDYIFMRRFKDGQREAYIIRIVK